MKVASSPWLSRLPTMTKAKGSDSVNVEVKANKLPVAQAGDDQTVEEAETVRFSSAGSSDEDGEIVEFQWDFGDGGTAEGPTVTHVFPDDGIFTVTLRVLDDGGSSGDDTAQW